jgi:calcium/calmodulin-dependent protein kinase I
MGQSGSKKQPSIKTLYKLQEIVGRGSFGVVKRAIRKADQKEFAVKIIKTKKLQSEEKEAIYSEVETMRQLEHPNCVQLYDTFEEKGKFYIVMELLGGDELFHRIVEQGSFSEAEAAAVTRDLLSAVHYLHSIGIVHRDLKPENLIYGDRSMNAVLKVTDFGLAGHLASNTREMTTACGTPGYVAPEVLKEIPYGAAVDIWSIGVILFTMLCGYPPFYCENSADLFELIKSGEFEFDAAYWQDMTESSKDLIRRMLTVDPDQRITSAEALEHHWITGGASTTPLPQTHTVMLKALNARAQLRKAVRTLIALNRFSLALPEIEA